MSSGPTISINSGVTISSTDSHGDWNTWAIASASNQYRLCSVTGCKFQVPQNSRRLINVYAINFMP